MAFNAKNLQYNKQEPSFLRKLKGEFGGLDGRHNVQIARPKKDRLKTGDGEEDDPVIVDESGERVEKAEFERRIRDGDAEDLALGEKGKEVSGDVNKRSTGPEEEVPERQKVTEIGGGTQIKKRKMAKIIGVVEEGDQKSFSVSKKPDGEEGFIDDARSSKKKDTETTKRKKGKKIKLSFDEQEG